MSDSEMVLKEDGPSGALASAKVMSDSAAPKSVRTLKSFKFDSLALEGGDAELKKEFDEFDTDHSGGLSPAEVGSLLRQLVKEKEELQKANDEVMRDLQIIEEQHAKLRECNETMQVDNETISQQRDKLLELGASVEAAHDETRTAIADEHAKSRTKLIGAFCVVAVLVAIAIAFVIDAAKEIETDNDGTLKTTDGAAVKTANTDMAVMGGVMVGVAHGGRAIRTQSMTQSVTANVTNDPDRRRLAESRMLPGHEYVPVEYSCNGVVEAIVQCFYNNQACESVTTCGVEGCGTVVIGHTAELIDFERSEPCKAHHGGASAAEVSSCASATVAAVCGDAATKSLTATFRVKEHVFYPAGTVFTATCRGICLVQEQVSVSRQLESAGDPSASRSLKTQRQLQVRRLKGCD